MSDKGSIYFNIFECGINLLDQLDVIYQCAFTSSFAASIVQKVYYQISPARDRYYDIIVDHIEENNVGTIDKDELRKAISHVKSEDKEEPESNIGNMVQDDDYKSPWRIKDATVATGLKTVTT